MIWTLNCSQSGCPVSQNCLKSFPEKKSLKYVGLKIVVGSLFNLTYTIISDFAVPRNLSIYKVEKAFQMKKLISLLFICFCCLPLAASGSGFNRQRNSSTFPSFPELSSSRTSLISLSNSVSFDSFICTNNQLELNPIFQLNLIENSVTIEEIEIENLDDVKLTLTIKGDSLKLTNGADFIHEKISKALKIKSYNDLWRFLKDSKDSPWETYMTFFTEEEPDKEKSLDEMRRLVALKLLRSFCHYDQ